MIWLLCSDYTKSSLLGRKALFTKTSFWYHRVGGHQSNLFHVPQELTCNTISQVSDEIVIQRIALFSHNQFVHHRISQDCVLPDRPHSNYNQSQESKTSPSVVTIGNYGGSSKQYAPDTLYTFRNNSFHTSPRLSQATRQKIMLGNSFRFNYQSGYLNVIQQPTGLVARGTPVTAMSQKQSPTKPVIRYAEAN